MKLKKKQFSTRARALSLNLWICFTFRLSTDNCYVVSNGRACVHSLPLTYTACKHRLLSHFFAITIFSPK